MNKLILSVFLLSCLVAVIQAGDSQPLYFRGEASRTKYGDYRQDSIRLSQDAWRSKDGRWSAGGYVQHDRNKYPGGSTKDTHGGIQVSGTF